MSRPTNTTDPSQHESGALEPGCEAEPLIAFITTLDRWDREAYQDETGVSE